MPAKSKKQLNFMKMVMAGKVKDHPSAPSKEVAREFIEKTPKSKFGKK